AAPPPAREVVLPLPRRGEMAVGRARSLAASGRLREPLPARETVRPADPQKPEAERLRGDIQHQLLGLSTLPRSTAPVPDRDKADTRRTCSVASASIWALKGSTVVATVVMSFRWRPARRIPNWRYTTGRTRPSV